jgi:predicted nucleic acid-binding protein
MTIRDIDDGLRRLIVLDTNVLSELLRPDPHPGVSAWVEAQPLASLFTTAVTSAELRSSVALLPHGARRRALKAAITGVLAEDFSGRILPFDDLAAQSYAAIAARRREAGAPDQRLRCPDRRHHPFPRRPPRHPQRARLRGLRGGGDRSLEALTTARGARSGPCVLRCGWLPSSCPDGVCS